MRRGVPERRRYPRIPLCVTASCFLSSGTLTLHTKNISTGGMLLEPCEQLARCQQIELEFSLPGHSTPIRICATVQHQMLGLGVGVKFQSLSEANRRAILSYLSGDRGKHV